MASSQVMSSTSPANPDLPRHSTAATIATANNHPLTPHSAAPHAPLYHLPNPFHPQNSDHAIAAEFGSMNMEEMLKNMYSEPDSLPGPESSAKNAPAPPGKTVDEVWKDIVAGGGEPAPSKEPRMTLEDFLTKAGAVNEEDVRGPPEATVPAVVAPGYAMDTMMNAGGLQFPAAPMPVVHMQNGPGNFGLEAHMGYGNGLAPAGPVRAGNGSSSRGKRRAPPVEEVVLDKATQQKQRRMIKNRESAARSRERKQAYNLELESLVTQHEEENARLLKELAEEKKQRYNQLMKYLIPVVEKRRPPRPLRRVQSMSW